jgi:hypothetical protein
MAASRLKQFGELIAGLAICLGWILGVGWLCDDPGPGWYATGTVWLAQVCGLAIAGIFEWISLRSVIAALWVWGIWFIAAVAFIDHENLIAWLLVAVALPAAGVGLGLIFGKRRARALR